MVKAHLAGAGLARLFSRAASLSAVALGGATLAGWYFIVPSLIHLSPNIVTMAPVSSLAMAIAGVAVFLLTFRWTRMGARVLAILLAVLAVIGILQHVIPLNVELEDAIVSGDQASTNRISPVVALCYLFLAVSLLFAGLGRKLRVLISDALVIAVLILALAVLIGYGLGAVSLYRHSSGSAAALQDAFGFLLLGCAILAASPDRGIMASLLDVSPGGQVLRRLLPVVVMAPFALAWLVQRGVADGLYSSTTETAIVALLTIVWLTMVVWVTAEIVRGTDVARRRAERELARQSEWLSTTLGSIQDAVIAFDKDALIRTMNARAEILTGRSAGEAAGLPVTDMLRVVDEHTRKAIDILTESPGEEPGQEPGTALLLSDGAAELPVETRTMPILGPNGQSRGGVLVFRDVTQRRRDAQRQAMLMGELNHRVKNVLAVVQSLVQASARRATTRSAKDLAAVLAQRIQSLGNAHQLLLETQWTGARLVAMIERELAPYQDEGKAVVHMRGDEVMLPAENTSILAMTIHELATNAAKYGALSRADGRLNVIWRVRDDRLLLIWRERHGGPLPPRRQPGFGLQLIEKGIQRNLGGESQVEFRSGGLRVMLRVPLRRPMPEDRPRLGQDV